MKKIKLIIFAAIAIFSLNSCEENIDPLGTNYVTFGEKSYSAGVDPGGSTNVEVKVYTANIEGSDRSFDLIVDGSGAADGSYTVPTSITIPGGTNEGTLTVALSDTNLGIGINDVVINFVGKAELSNGGSTTISYLQNCTEVTATLDIVFDGYGNETGWEIRDSLGGVVIAKEAGTYAEGQATAKETITLCAGRDYTFKILDAYGDGLSFPVNGTYSLTIGSTVKASGSGDFGKEEETSFDTK